MFHIKSRYIFILLLGSYSYLNIKFTEGDSLFTFKLPELAFYGVILGLVFLLWEGNRLLKTLSEKLPSRQAFSPPLNHFIISLVWVLVISTIASFIVPKFLGLSFSWITMKLMIGFVFRVNLFLHCINAIIFYHRRSKEAGLQIERFKKESIEAQFSALKNQLNPHFLFNSLNVLSNLIYKDTETSNEFITQLAEVYRYVLKNQDKKLIKLEEELAFIQSYIFLVKIRFQENLKIELNIKDERKTKYIAPSTLQILIENAIKHNEISKNKPLKVEIFTEGNYIVTENPVQKKQSKEESSNIGLTNIRNRYSFLSKENPVIVSSNGTFTVKIPLIEVD